MRLVKCAALALAGLTLAFGIAMAKNQDSAEAICSSQPAPVNLVNGGMPTPHTPPPCSKKQPGGGTGGNGNQLNSFEGGLTDTPPPVPQPTPTPTARPDDYPAGWFGN